MHARLRLGAVALVFLLVSLLGGAHLCEVAQDAGARPLSAGALACTEFWINRYQTLLAALIAGAIALWAGRLLFKQVETQRFDFLSRQLLDLQRIHSAAWELYVSCNFAIGPDRKVRLKGKLPPLGHLAPFETPALEFWYAIQDARAAIVRLEAVARHPTGPFQTSNEAERLAQVTARYLQICEVDVLPRLDDAVPPRQNDRQESDLRERHPQTRELHLAISEVVNALAEVYRVEAAALRNEQARAHSAAI